MSRKEKDLTQLVQKTETAVTEWAGKWADDGNSDIPPTFPIVSICQPMTQTKGAVAGWFQHSDTGECTSDFDGVLLIRRETRAMFVDNDEKPICRSDDGREPAPRQRLWQMEPGSRISINKQTHGVPPVAPRDCANCPFSDWGDGLPPLCGNQYVIIAARNGDPEDLVQLRLKGTSIRPYRQWVSRKVLPQRRPMYSFQVHLTTEEHVEPSKKWYQLVIDSYDMTREEAMTFSAVIDAHRARIEHAVKEAGGEVEEWQDDAEEMPFE